MKVIAIIPAHNEEKTIGKVIEDMPSIVNEIIVIDDGSTDKTSEIAKEKGAFVISFRRNRGLAIAYREGLKEALKRSADIVVSLDADYQHNPKEIPKLLEPIIKGDADLVIGSRFINKAYKMSFLKYYGNIAFTKLINLLLGLKLTDTQSGFRAFTKEVAENLRIKQGFTYTQQMIVQAAYHRFKITEIPIKTMQREGKSRLIKTPFHFAYNAMQLLIFIFAKFYPLRFFVPLGISLMIVGAYIGLAYERNILSSLIISTGINSILFGILFEILKE